MKNSNFLSFLVIALISIAFATIPFTAIQAQTLGNMSATVDETEQTKAEIDNTYDAEITLNGISTTVHGSQRKDGSINYFRVKVSQKSGKQYREYLGTFTGTEQIDGAKLPIFEATPTKKYPNGRVSYLTYSFRTDTIVRRYKK